MARAFLHAALRTDERQPRPNHAVEPRIEVGGITFRPPQATGHVWTVPALQEQI